MKTAEKPLLRLDLGAGTNPKEGFKSVDKFSEKADYKIDLFKFPWPFKEESVSELYANQFFEHIPHHLRVPFMDECYRVLVPNGKITVISPYWTSMRAIQDPTHEWPPISESSFLYFNKGWREQNKLTHYLGKCDFDFSYGYAFFPDWAARNDEGRLFAVKHYHNVVSDIHVTLTKRPNSVKSNGSSS